MVWPQSWRAKQRTFKLAPDVKTLVGPSPEQADHYATLVTPAACNQPFQCLAKGQALPHRALFQAKLAPKSLVRFDLTGHSDIKRKTPHLHCMLLTGWLTQLSASNYLNQWHFQQFHPLHSVALYLYSNEFL